jgi:hypothetical protein
MYMRKNWKKFFKLTLQKKSDMKIIYCQNWHCLCLNKIVNYQNVSRVKNR